jgi:hypothetical protein
MIDWFIVFNATFSNISAISWRPVLVQGAGAAPGFQVRGGALKKIAPSGGKCENFWGILCEKSRFYPPWILPWGVLGIKLEINNKEKIYIFARMIDQLM